MNSGPGLGDRRPVDADVDLDVVVRASVGLDDVELLLARARRRLMQHRVVAFDVRAVTTPDAGTIDALARIQLCARQLGGEIVLRSACPALLELIDLAGLREILPVEGGLRLESSRQPEQGEEALRVEEEGDPADPIA